MEHILSLSYGKDSLACLGAIKELNWPLDRIIHSEFWATKDNPGELPKMVEFKTKADRIIKEKFGYEVEHIKTNRTYEEQFYHIRTKGPRKGIIYGFPFTRGAWCQTLKVSGLKQIEKGHIVYLGIASDEEKRFHNLTENKKSPLVELGWTEQDCKEWCEKNDLLSPIYVTERRGGCWFCHNNNIEGLRNLYHNLPEYWELLLKWDSDSPYAFKADGFTVHDFDKRFKLEDEGLIPTNKTFRWNMLDKTKEELEEIKEKHKGKSYLLKSN